VADTGKSGKEKGKARVGICRASVCLEVKKMKNYSEVDRKKTRERDNNELYRESSDGGEGAP